jgi:hypothetical protein
MQETREIKETTFLLLRYEESHLNSFYFKQHCNNEIRVIYSYWGCHNLYTQTVALLQMLHILMPVTLRTSVF